MDKLKNYEYDDDVPLSQPYDQKGTFNAYFKGVQRESGKQVLISEYRQNRQQQILARYKKLLKLKTVDHENIAKIYEVIHDKEGKRLFVVLEWCDGGSLLDYQKKETTFQYKTVLRIVRSLTEGLKAIHDADLIHRFINLENIEFDGKGVPKLTMKCLYYKSYYLSPDEKQGNRKRQNDIFSLGIVIHKLIYLNTPFKGNSIEEYAESVKEGVKYPKKGEQMFPLCAPAEVKSLINSMTAFKCEERLSCDEIIIQCEDMLSEEVILTHIPISVRKKLFKPKYIPVQILYHSMEETELIGLNPQTREFLKICIYKGKMKELKEYQKQILINYIKVDEVLGLVPIYEYKFIENQYLMIVSFYDNQGSINQYFQAGGTLPLSHTKQFIQKLTNKLKKLKKTHNHLTYDNVVIRKGNFYIKYPPFKTKQYLSKLQNNMDEVIMIAPEVLDGRQGDKGDSWSIAMFKYRLENGGEMPNFDKNNKLILNRKHKSKEDLQFYENFLVKDPNERKNMLREEEESEIQKVQVVKVLPVKKTQQKLKKPPKGITQQILQKFKIFLFLQKHWTKPLRILMKCIIGLIFFIFLFYFNFFLINGALLAEHSIYQAKTIQIRAFDTDSTTSINYTVVTKTPDTTYNSFFNSTLSVLRDDEQCVLNDFSVESDIADIVNRSGFTAYQVFGILFSLTNLLLYCIVLSKMDFPKIYYISPIQEGNYNSVWSWLFITLAIASQISITYLLYGSLFHLSLEPCIQKPTLTAVQFLFKDWVFSFNIRFIWVYIGLLFSYAVVIYFILRPNKQIHIAVKVVLIVLYLTGIGARAMGGSGGDISGTKESVFGKCGELLVLITGVIFFTIDMIFSCCIDKNKTEEEVQAVEERNKEKHNQSTSQFNQTEEALA